MKAEGINLDQVGTYRELLIDLIEHYGECEAEGRQYKRSQNIQNICDEILIINHYLKRLVSRDFNKNFYASEINAIPQSLTRDQSAQ